MSFKIIERPEFTRDVTVTMPDGSEQVLKTRFVGVPPEELETFDPNSVEGLKAMMRAVVQAFLDVEAPGGEVFPKVCLDESEEAARLFEWLLATHYVRLALQREYTNAMLGLKGPRRGN